MHDAAAWWMYSVICLTSSDIGVLDVQRDMPDINDIGLVYLERHMPDIEDVSGLVCPQRVS